jgi:hypothetical protein
MLTDVRRSSRVEDIENEVDKTYEFLSPKNQ